MLTVGGSVIEIGQRFIETFNRRDAKALVALADPTINFHPTPLADETHGYRGRKGLWR
jgi:hypothetical protein